jgi:hypothetical protein
METYFLEFESEVIASAILSKTVHLDLSPLVIEPGPLRLFILVGGGAVKTISQLVHQLELGHFQLHSGL